MGQGLRNEHRHKLKPSKRARVTSDQDDGPLRAPRRSIVAKTLKVSDAIESIPDGVTLMIGGFMAVGSPRRLIDELVRQGKKGLTVIANDWTGSSMSNWRPK